MPDQQQPKYELSHLQNYILLHQLLTGERPTVIRLSPDFYTWYVQEVAKICEGIGVNIGFKDNKVTYTNIPIEKIEKPVKIETVSK